MHRARRASAALRTACTLLFDMPRIAATLRSVSLSLA
jgi:hypothetical protein